MWQGGGKENTEGGWMRARRIPRAGGWIPARRTRWVGGWMAVSKVRKRMRVNSSEVAPNRVSP